MNTDNTPIDQKNAKTARQPWITPQVAVMLPAELTQTPPCGTGPGNANGQCAKGS